MLNYLNVEQVFAILSLGSSSLLIGSTYLPPSSSLSVIESHLSTVENLITTLKATSTIIFGDYNLPGITWSSGNLGLSATGVLSPSSSLIIDSFSFLNFFQLNYTRNCSGNILDLVFSSSNNPSVLKAPAALINPDPYHPPLLIKLSHVNKPSIDVTHSYYDFKAGDFESISNFFNSFNWDATFSNYSINDAATVFNDAILNSIKKFVPKKIFRTSKFPRWVSPSLKTLIKKKKYAHKLFKQTNRASDYSAFSELRAKCKHLSHSDYRSFISDTENYLSSNPSYFWKYTRDLKQHSLIPSSVHLSGVTADNPLSSANLFSKFFSSVFKPPLLSNSNSVRSITINMDTITDMKNSDQIKVVKSNGSEPRNFKNGSHSVGVLHGLQSLRNYGVLCDISLKTDDSSIVFGHKNVLMAASPYFHAMFRNFDESNKNLVNIRDLDSTVLELLVNYIYTGEIMITEENVQSLLPAANLLQLDYVNGVCTEFMQTQLRPSNCLGIKAFADLHNSMELLSISEVYIKQKFLYVAQCEEFLSLSYKEVIELISCSDLFVPYEEKMYECIINWVNHELDSRTELLPELMEHVHLPLVSIEYLLKKVVEEPLIKNSIKFKDYLFEALHFHLHKLKPDITIPQTFRCSSRQSAGFKKDVLVLYRSNTINQISTNWYDPTTDQWEIAPEMNGCRISAGIAILKDQFLFAVGGIEIGGSRFIEMLDLSLLSPIWVPTVDMLVGRTGFRVAVLNDYIYAVGGYDDGSKTYLNSAEVFNINIQKWKMIFCMTSKRACFGIAVLNNRLYATALTEMSERRSGVSVGVLDNVIYAVGGQNRKGYLKSVVTYKPSDGAWTSVADMHEYRAFADVFALNGLLYIIGGRNIEGNSLNSVEIYNPNTNTWSMKTLSSDVGRIYATIAVNRPVQT
ncbi:hypothetical protein ACI65C_007849 [Semiaphis heraclei]